MVGIEEARSRFSTLVREAREGAEITITVYGKPAAKLVPVEGPAHQDGLDGALVELRALRDSLDKIQPHIKRLAEKKP